MNCKDTDKLIPLFLMDQLSNKDLEHFLKHINKCNDCKEELTIQYLVMIGSSLLEEGKSFDLAEALSSLITVAQRKVRRWKFFYRLSYIFEVFTMILTILILVMVIL